MAIQAQFILYLENGANPTCREVLNEQRKCKTKQAKEIGKITTKLICFSQHCIKKKLPADANAAQTAKKTKPIFSGDISLLKTILVIIEAVIEANC